MNKCIFMGNMVRDIEIKGEGEKLRGNFTLALNGFSKGEKTTTFVNCTAFGKNAETIQKYCPKGRPLLVEASVNVVNYKDKDGISRTYTSFNVSRLELVGSRSDSNESAQAPAPASQPASDGFMNIDDSDLPWA